MNRIGPATGGDDDGVPELDQSVIDMLQGLGEADLFDELVALFRDEVGRQVSELDRAILDGDPAVVRQIAHSVKGASANMGAVRLAEAASALEQLALSGDLVEAPAVTIEVGVRYRRACDALERHVSASADGARAGSPPTS